MIDSGDFLEAKRRAEIESLLPSDPRSFSPAASLQRRSRHLGRAGQYAGHVSPHGAAAWRQPTRHRIAACWDDSRKVPRIAFKPNWRVTPRPRCSNTRIRCSNLCRSASSSSRAQAFRTTFPTRRESAASQFGVSTRALRERYCSQTNMATFSFRDTTKEGCSARKILGVAEVSGNAAESHVRDRPGPVQF